MSGKGTSHNTTDDDLKKLEKSRSKEQLVRGLSLLIFFIIVIFVRVWCSIDSPQQGVFLFIQQFIHQPLLKICFQLIPIFLELVLCLYIYSQLITLSFLFVTKNDSKQVFKWFFIIFIIIAIEYIAALLRREIVLYDLYLYVYELEFNLNLCKEIIRNLINNALSPFVFVLILHFGSYEREDKRRQDARGIVEKEFNEQNKELSDSESVELFKGKCKLDDCSDDIDVLLNVQKDKISERLYYLYLNLEGGKEGVPDKIDIHRDVEGLGCGYSYKIEKVFVSSIDYHIVIKTLDQKKIHLIFCDQKQKAYDFYKFMVIIQHFLEKVKKESNKKIDFIDMREEVGPNVRIDPIYGITDYLN